MKGNEFKLKARVWVYDDSIPWHFVTIDKDTSEEIKRFDNMPRRGFGSVPVNVRMGNTKWKTSVFPGKDGTFLLPLKKQVREAEGIKVKSNISFTIAVIG